MLLPRRVPCLYLSTDSSGLLARVAAFFVSFLTQVSCVHRAAVFTEHKPTQLPGGSWYQSADLGTVAHTSSRASCSDPLPILSG